MLVAESVLAGMRETNDIFCAKVIRDRNMDAVERIYTANAHILPPGADILVGIPAIADFWANAITGLDVKDASLTNISAEAARDGAVEIGRAELVLAGGQVVPVKYVVHWVQINDAWKWQTDIWNMNA